MSRFRTIEITEPYYFPSSFIQETFSFKPRCISFPSFAFEEPESEFIAALDLLDPNPTPFQLFDSYTDLIEVRKTPSICSYKRVHERVGTERSLRTLCDRVSDLESKFERLLSSRSNASDRKYTWTAELGAPVERKFTLTAEIKGERKKKEEEKKVENARRYKWKTEIKGKGSNGWRTYKIEASSGDVDDSSSGSEDERKKEKKEKKCRKDKKEHCAKRLVKIEEPTDHGAVVLRQAFAKRSGAVRSGKGKQKEVSPQDAAMMIQMSFRAYLIRRSQALRALRELAIAKAKLKEIRELFNNFAYRNRIANDAAERQRFSERIIVLLLTVDSIEGADFMVRGAKRSMIDELEAMLDVVDPQPARKSLSMRRRTFDMPDGLIRKEIAEGVAHVVRMLDNEEKSGNTFEAC